VSYVLVPGLTPPAPEVVTAPSATGPASARRG